VLTLVWVPACDAYGIVAFRDAGMTDVGYTRAQKIHAPLPPLKNKRQQNIANKKGPRNWSLILWSHFRPYK
jgi:hypothetical protein